MMRKAILLLPALFLSACTVGPDFKPPAPPQLSTYAAKGDEGPPKGLRLALGKKVEAEWWKGFALPSLNGVIHLALQDNQTIAAAKAHMAEAEEEVNAAEGALLPQVSLGAVAGRQKYGAALFGPLNFNIPPFTYYTVGPSVSFPLDLFGGDRRTVEEKKAYLAYQRYELEATYQSLAAHVAAEALALAAARAQITALNAIIADDRRNVDLVKVAIEAGSGTKVQLVSAQTQLASDRTLLPDLRQRESTARHALAVLVGKAPAQWVPPNFVLTDFTLPHEIPVSLPSQLVHRRPDILAAESQLHMASAAIGVATANLYPKIDLSASLTQQALTPGGLFNSVAAAWSIAAGITQPIFEGGRLSAERRAAIDNYKVALAAYRQVILVAFGDVADRLQAISNDADRLHAQMVAAKMSAQSVDLARRSYQAGNSGILDVIDAERRSAQARLGVAGARSQRLLDIVQLYLALGGGMSRSKDGAGLANS